MSNSCQEIGFDYHRKRESYHLPDQMREKSVEEGMEEELVQNKRYDTEMMVMTRAIRGTKTNSDIRHGRQSRGSVNELSYDC